MRSAIALREPADPDRGDRRQHDRRQHGGRRRPGSARRTRTRRRGRTPSAARESPSVPAWRPSTRLVRRTGAASSRSKKPNSMSPASAVPLVSPASSAPWMIVPGTTKREVGGDVGEPAQALRGARPARDHREQHQRQHERRHQQLRAPELHAQRAPAERGDDPALARDAHARLPGALEVRAGDGGEHVVERRRLDLDRLDHDVVLVERADHRRDRALAGRRAQHDARRRGGIGRLDGAEPGERRAGALGAVRVGQLDVQRRLADARLQRVRRPLGDEPAGGDDADAVGELLGLLEVLRGEEDGRAVVVERAHLAPQRAAARRVQAGRRLVEEQHARPVHEREREVEPPPHPAGVAADAAVAGLREPDALEQLGRALARRAGRAARAARPACAAARARSSAGRSPPPAARRRSRAAPRRRRARRRGRRRGRRRRSAAAAW